MQTELVEWARTAQYGKEADDIIHRCVHCGFCLATCPTYQIMGDELDSPRGRIYQIKQILEGHEPSYVTQQHLDRCLTCHNCETTCPSGVQYGNLIDIGRKVISTKLKRPWRQRVLFYLLRTIITSPYFSNLYRFGLVCRPLMPEAIKAKLHRPQVPQVTAKGSHSRKVIMLKSCVQTAMAPNIDAATVNVLDALGIEVQSFNGANCCGAIDFHLDAQEQAKAKMRLNIKAWLPRLESGEFEALVVNASGCGGMIKKYAQNLKYDDDYAEQAARLMPYVKDIAEFLAPMTSELKAKIDTLSGRYAFHPPCTLQHWQGLRVTTERLLNDLGFDLQYFAESHLCCGSAGTYSVTQPKLSLELRNRKLKAIEESMPDTIISANIGCICHLQGGTAMPVRHWVETVNEALNGR